LPALLLLEELPDRAHWSRHVKEPDPAVHGSMLARAVDLTTDHQSEQATDFHRPDGSYGLG
jgi:hypothetical protein